MRFKRLMLSSVFLGFILSLLGKEWIAQDTFMFKRPSYYLPGLPLPNPVLDKEHLSPNKNKAVQEKKHPDHVASIRLEYHWTNNIP